ncbi:AAA ATPase, partial [Linderina pennispora]
MPATRSTRTPQRRAALAEAPVSRQQQATSSLKESFPVAKTPAKSSYLAMKKVMHRSTTAPQIIGRSAEQSSIRAFLRDTVEQNRGGSLYISGNPGTGKTACLQSIMSQSKVKFTSVLVNCVPLTRPTQAYMAILEALGVKFTGDPLGALENHVLHNKRAFMVVLDEVDSLLGARQEVLYRLFELAKHPDSHMALVGIANALDLTDRFLPRLQARNCEPVLLNFNPYQVKDIVEILQSRLSSVSGQEAEPIIQKAALELCARKVAATSGDLRKALDVCRQAMEKAETETKRKSADKENAAGGGLPKVTLMHIAK